MYLLAPVAVSHSQWDCHCFGLDMKQFDDIKDVVSYIEEIVAGIGDPEE